MSISPRRRRIVGSPMIEPMIATTTGPQPSHGVHSMVPAISTTLPTRMIARALSASTTDRRWSRSRRVRTRRRSSGALGLPAPRSAGPVARCCCGDRPLPTSGGATATPIAPALLCNVESGVGTREQRCQVKSRAGLGGRQPSGDGQADTADRDGRDRGAQLGRDLGGGRRVKPRQQHDELLAAVRYTPPRSPSAVVRAIAVRRSATSPCAWPSRSLSALKWSRSNTTIETGTPAWPCRNARARRGPSRRDCRGR